MSFTNSRSRLVKNVVPTKKTTLKKLEISLDWFIKYISGAWSVSDPYHFDTDPDPGCKKIRYGSGSRANFDTDPDPGKNDTDPDPAKKD